MPRRKALTPHQLQKKEREARAIELRLAGVSYEQIGNQLGITRGAASSMVKRAMEKRHQEPVEELRRMEVERLDKLLFALWPEAMRGKWLAIDRVLKVMERRATMLGLDAPQRRIVDVVTDDAFKTWLAQTQKENEELGESRPKQIEEADYTIPEAEVVEDAQEGQLATKAA